MANSLKLEILKALTSVIETTAIKDGADYDLEGKVFRGRTTFGINDPMPCISILEAKGVNFADFADENKLYSKSDWTLLVQGWADNHSDPRHETDAVYMLLADVQCTLRKIIDVKTNGMGSPIYPEHYMLGNRIHSFTMGEPVVRPSEIDVSSKAFFYMPVMIGLTSH